MHENHQLQGHHCSTISGPYMYAHPSQHSNQLKTKLSDYCLSINLQHSVIIKTKNIDLGGKSILTGICPM